MIGQVLGSYRVVSKIGAGGMGTIWLAEHQLLGSRAAIKVLQPEMSAQRRIVQRFFDEARAATRIQDPGIVTVLDFGWHDGAAYLVMEYLAGESLGARLDRTDRIPVVQAVRLIQQCAIAMAAAHARGIVHRDLKPDNIYLVADPAMPGGERIKILDFGIAKLIDDADASHSRTQTGVIMGTPAFMSPEQCRGAGGVDHRTDIYALGCVLFNMVCGRPPFVANTPGDLIVSQISQSPPTPSALAPGLPVELDTLVARCLEKDAERRFASMTELVRAGASITGDNLSVETIPPRRASGERLGSSDPERGNDGEGRATVATGAPPISNTTLRGSTGEASLAQTRPWRGGMFIAIGVLVAAGVIVVVAMTSGSSRRVTVGGPGSAGTAGSTSTITTGTGTGTGTSTGTGMETGTSSVIDAGVPDAATPQPTGSGTTRVPARPKKPSGPPRGGSGSGSGSSSGSGSGSGKPYDPYGDR